jgi:VanZ family protein
MDRWQNFVMKVSRIALGIALMLMPWGTLSTSVPTPPSCAWFLHVSALAGLTVLVLLSFDTSKVRALAVIVIFLYSAFLEVLQLFNPARHGSMEDIGANALGCLIGLVVYLVFLLLYRAVMAFRETHILKPSRWAQKSVE